MGLSIHGVNRRLFIVLIIVMFFSLFYTSGAFTWVTGKHSGFCAGSCIDTDSGSVYLQGKVSGKDDNCRTFERIDYCFVKNSKHWVKEYSCDITKPDNWKSESTPCPYGCKDGACL